MKQLTRIVTWMGYPDWGTPQGLLSQGSGTYTLPDSKTRLYAVRKVNYDDSLTPIYASPMPLEKTYTDIDELRRLTKGASYSDGAVLDIDNKLKIYRP